MNYNKCDYSAMELADGVIFRMKDDVTGFYKLVDNEQYYYYHFEDGVFTRTENLVSLDKGDLFSNLLALRTESFINIMDQVVEKPRGKFRNAFLHFDSLRISVENIHECLSIKSFDYKTDTEIQTYNCEIQFYNHIINNRCAYYGRPDFDNDILINSLRNIGVPIDQVKEHLTRFDMFCRIIISEYQYPISPTEIKQLNY
ncbi:hypothetical protein ACLEXX_17630 [Enterobacter ludwigii]|uniref:hypothetical protein n=1 Tax=Enterobacter ludwigii TaxID=299767 RepID=UPI0039749D5F